MKIAIMGAGGIGAYTGGRLAAAGGDVVFIARGAQLDALRAGGLKIRSPRGDAVVDRVVATSEPREVGTVDLVIFSVKLWDTALAANAMLPMIGDQTLVVTFQNGVDSVDILSNIIPRSQVVPGAYYISAHVASPGNIEDTGADNRMVIDGMGGDNRITEFKDTCDRAVGLVCEIANPEVDFVWQKFIVLTAFSGSTALIRKPLGAVYGHPVTRDFLHDLIEEAAKVAFAKGARLPPGIVETVFARLTSWAPDAYASMAVDLMHGRRLELPWLSARVHALGKELGIETPAHTAVYRALILHEMG